MSLRGRSATTGTNAAALAAVADGNRNAGVRLRVRLAGRSRGPCLVVYGARYAQLRLHREGALQPARCRSTSQPIRRHAPQDQRVAQRRGAGRRRVRAARCVERRGCRRERTFAPIVGTTFTPERTDTYQFARRARSVDDSIVAVRAFVQHTDDQIATLFGLGSPSSRAAEPRITTTSRAPATSTARGWTVSVRQVIARRACAARWTIP